MTKASITVLIEALKEEQTLADDGGDLPPRSIQVAELIAAETVRLIRLGTRDELTEARLELARAVADEDVARLGERHPKVRRLLAGSSVALSFATAPSSGAGELAVLRSWNGRAAEVVDLVDRAPEKSLRRAELRERLGIDESHLSHVLADLEAANLIARRSSGREVTVHLGRTGRSRHVAEFIRGIGDDPEDKPDQREPEMLVRSAFRELIERSDDPAAEPSCPALRPLLREVAELNRDASVMSHDILPVADGWVTCRINTWVRDAEDEGTASLEDRYLFWSAKVEDGAIVDARSLAPAGRWFQAVTAGHGRSSEPLTNTVSDEKPPVDSQAIEYRNLDVIDYGTVEKFDERVTMIYSRNDVKGYGETHRPLADLSLLPAAIER